MFGKPVFLLTDILIFVVMFVVLLFFLYARTKPHIIKPWRQVVRSKAGVVSIIVLSLYIFVAVLDSMHFHPELSKKSDSQVQTQEEAKKETQKEIQYSGEVVSVFDLLVSHLRNSSEKTYSAPFATQLYAKETVNFPNGTKQRIYPRLEWGGSHLEYPETEKKSDILKLSAIGFLKAIVVWLALMSAISFYRASRSGVTFMSFVRSALKNELEVPWRTIAVTLAIVLAVLLMSAEWASKYHIFGTDKVGEDVLYQALKSIRTGVLIGTLTTLLVLPLAITLGIMAGYFRGWVDDVIQYIYTTLNSIPGILLIAAAVLMLQVHMNNNADQFSSLTIRSDYRLLFLCLILGLTSWTGLCRLLRAESLKLREVDYVQAASAFGVGPMQTIFKHILPNVMHIVLITVVLEFSSLVMAEAVLAYVNIGVDPTMNSWGNMINSARLQMAREPVVWWSLAASLFFMFTLVLFANLFADVVRDALDPRIAKQ